jgi:hypothetical protein
MRFANIMLQQTALFFHRKVNSRQLWRAILRYLHLQHYTKCHITSYNYWRAFIVKLIIECQGRSPSFISPQNYIKMGHDGFLSHPLKTNQSHGHPTIRSYLSFAAVKQLNIPRKSLLSSTVRLNYTQKQNTFQLFASRYSAHQHKDCCFLSDIVACFAFQPVILTVSVSAMRVGGRLHIKNGGRLLASQERGYWPVPLVGM